MTEPGGGGGAPPPDGEPRSSGGLRSVIRALATPGERLSQRVVHGGLWRVIQHGSVRALTLIKLVILARILLPEDFGLFGIALLTQQTLDVLLKFGIDAALIQRADDAEDHLDTAWTLKLARAAVVAGALFVVAPYAAAFFQTPRATPLIRVLGVFALLEGLDNIGIVYFRKELDFRKEFTLEFWSTAANALTAVTLAVVLGSAWALIAGIVAMRATRLVLSYALHPYRPRLDLEPEKVRNLWNFGRWLLGSSILGYGSTQGDDILLGRWLGASALGIYQVSYRVANLVATEVAHVVSSVVYPAYAKIQTLDQRLRLRFLDTFALTALVVVPMAAAVGLFIPEIVAHVLGSEWRPIVGPVRILALAGLVRALSACWGPLYQAQARTEKPFWKSVIRVTLTLGPAYPMTMLYGIEGMSACVLAGIGGAFAYDLTLGDRGGTVAIGAGAVARELVGPVGATAGAMAAVGPLRAAVESSLLSLAGLGILFLAVYAGLVALLEKAGWKTGCARLVELVERTA